MRHRKEKVIAMDIAINKIQNWYRTISIQRYYRNKCQEKIIRKRVNATIRIQAKLRSYLAYKNYHKKKSRISMGIGFLLVLLRRYIGRKRLKRTKAVICIQKFMKKIWFLKFKDVVILVMHFQLEPLRRFKSTLIIKRTIRRFIRSRRRMKAIIAEFMQKRYWRILIKFISTVQRKIKVYYQLLQVS